MARDVAVHDALDGVTGERGVVLAARERESRGLRRLSARDVRTAEAAVSGRYRDRDAVRGQVLDERRDERRMHELVRADHEQRARPIAAPRRDRGARRCFAVDDQHARGTDLLRDAMRALGGGQPRDHHARERVVREDDRIQLQRDGHGIRLHAPRRIRQESSSSCRIGIPPGVKGPSVGGDPVRSSPPDQAPSADDHACMAFA
jgi:hypothetical protein